MITEKVTIELTGLSAKIRSAITDSTEGDGPEIDRIVTGIEDALDGDEVSVALRKGLRLLVEREARNLKREAMRRAQEDAQRVEYPKRRAQQKRAAAAQLAEVTATHEQMIADRFFATWKETPTGRKFLGECTADDLRYSQQRNLERSGQLQDAARADERLAVAVEEAGCQTVRDLGYASAARAVAGHSAHPSQAVAA